MSLLGFAYGAGLLAVVNPCGFALLPAYLGYFLGKGSERGGHPGFPGATRRAAHGFAVGVVVAAGFAAVFAAAGLLAWAGLRPLLGYVPWAAVAIGGALVVLGVAMLAGRRVGVAALGDRLRPAEGRGLRQMAVFGVAYAVCSLSCTLAVLLAVVAAALATGNPLQMLAVFAAYSAGAATLLVALAVSASLAQAATARALRRLLPLAGRLGGALLVASGAYLVAYWLPALDARAPAQPDGGHVADLSTRLTVLVEANQGLFTVLGAALALAGVALAVARRRTASAACCPPDPPEGRSAEEPERERATGLSGTKGAA